MLRFLLKLFVFLLVIIAIAVLAIIFVPIKRSGPTSQLPENYRVAEGQGEYVARMADCAACHTAPNGAAYAGGREVASPFGTIYASNITPAQNGIAGWTLDDFRAALQDGVRPDGMLLYPAMPYENYRKLREEDIVALYDYFMHDVQPVDEAVKKTGLTFPFNQRWGIRLWNWFATSRQAGYEPRYNDTSLDRGAYLVESLAHCGACHTPRNLIFRQKGLDATSTDFLTGSTLNGWYAPDLRGENSAVATWGKEELRSYLTTGRNSQSAVIGPMRLVVGESLQYAKNEDMEAILAYLTHIAAKKPPVAAPNAAAPQKQQTQIPALAPTTALLSRATPTNMPLGARIYLDNCNACHMVDGKGAAGIFPALDGARLVTADDPSGLIEIILGGARMPSTEHRPADIAMPAFGWRLSDAEVAELVNFLRSSWGNTTASSVSAGAVAKIRANPLKD
ncbi:MAG: Cytochrome C oxidase, cbb3-type, subunit III [Candidatus Tokpelaia hoelldobleri]|uniref:Cytochrome C oxidase, cbb3-type, subunit III n=1 Tax=Candidatus Tokpelaia hoelldobleri TaxID=1902579 RepID=A0A1U9JX61_9HYPH|nr:MAG: Cytochrome C oxidase, cbb3-type, subunit III [Candidatus Tokpelaia hoelldoblerii]